MKLTTTDDALWLIGFAGQLALVLVLFWKRRASHFPFFSALATFDVARGITLFLLRHDQRAYFYCYWSLAFVDTVLQLLVIHEIARKVFKPGGSWSKDVARPLIVISAVSVGVAALLACISVPPAAVPIVSFVVKGELFSTMLVSGLFAGLMLLSVISGFVWRSYTGVIARGIGVYSVCSLLLQGLQHYIGLGDGAGIFHTLAHVQVVCFLGCLSYWIVGLLQPAPLTQPLPQHLLLQLSRLDAFMDVALLHLRSDRASS